MEFRGKQMAVQCTKLETKCKKKLKMWHPHAKISKNCKYKKTLLGIRP